jgi:hypothetical protein
LHGLHMDSMGLLSNYEDFMRAPRGVHVDSMETCGGL